MSRDHEDDFRTFVRARSGRLLASAYLLTGDRGTAEDLLQLALLRAYRHWAHIRSRDNPEWYVRRIMVNQRTAWWRRRRPDELLVAAVPEPAGVQPDAVTSHADRDALWRALRQLPPRTRAVLVLRYWEDMSETETARMLGCSVGTVKSTASRGLRRLRQVITAAEPHPDHANSGGAR